MRAILSHFQFCMNFFFFFFLNEKILVVIVAAFRDYIISTCKFQRLGHKLKNLSLHRSYTVQHFMHSTWALSIHIYSFSSNVSCKSVPLLRCVWHHFYSLSFSVLPNICAIFFSLFVWFTTAHEKRNWKIELCMCPVCKYDNEIQASNKVKTVNDFRANVHVTKSKRYNIIILGLSLFFSRKSFSACENTWKSIFPLFASSFPLIPTSYCKT